MARDWFNELLEIIVKRKDPKAHADADCEFICDKTWLDECWHAFFYGIAHILKHHSRKEAEDIREAGNASPEKSQNLARIVGWADEFFWLSFWSCTGKLKGRPEITDKTTPFDLFFHVLITTEWGDLLRNAWFFYRVGRVGVEPGGDGANRFEIWRPRLQIKRRTRRQALATTLYMRAWERFETAGMALSRLKSHMESGAIPGQRFLAEVVSDLERHLNIGWAGITCANGNRERARKHLRVALEATPGQAVKERKFVRHLIRCVDNPGVDAGVDEVTARANAQRVQALTPVHILAEWIEDLLQDKEQGTVLHPRFALPKEDPRYNRDVTTFPNPDAIDRIKTLLKENQEWITFATCNDGELRHVVEDIEKRNDSLSHRVFTASPSQDDGDDPCDGWRLFVLRDWGSFTPLLPGSLRQEEADTGRDKTDQAEPAQTRNMGGGGGYFLRWNRRGIVIDPGYDYVPHFYEAGLTPNMITDVIVTHDHYDHASSFGPLLNLLFEDRKDRKDKEKIDFYLSRGVFDQYARFIVDYKHFGRVEPLTDEDGIMGRRHVLCRKPLLQLLTTHTEHGDKDGFGRGVGLIFKFSGGLPSLGISSDTGWYGQCNVGKTRNRSLGGAFAEYSPDVVVLHVGSLKSAELHDSGFYRTHLGGRGVFRMIEVLKCCRLAVLSEFGEECREHRQWFAERITNHFTGCPGRHNFRCFPSDRKTFIEARGRQLYIGPRDTRGASQLYTNATVKEASDGTFRFQ